MKAELEWRGRMDIDSRLRGRRALHTVYSKPPSRDFVDRRNISETLTASLRELIVDGRLEAGSRINEVHLAAQFGLSRTPLREALGRLEGEGAVYTVPRIGFFVRPLSLEEFQQIYPIRALLDPEALRLAGIPAAPRIRELAALNAAIHQAKSAAAVVPLDDRWHLELLAGCPNPVLIDLIKQFMRRTRRYEFALMREVENVRATTSDHERILSALRKRDLSGACRALKENMTSGAPAIEKWLKGRDTK